MSDFPHEVSLLAADAYPVRYEQRIHDLFQDDMVRKSFDNGSFQIFSQKFELKDGMGQVIARAACGDIWHLTQRCEYFVSVHSQVLSFKTLEGAERAFQLLAKPGMADVYLSFSTSGERELNKSSIGDESRVFDSSSRDTLIGSSSQSVRLVARKERILVLLSGLIENEDRWGPGPIDAAYYTSLASRIVERVEHQLNAAN